MVVLTLGLMLPSLALAQYSNLGNWLVYKDKRPAGNTVYK
jgi:hypothetical protein